MGIETDALASMDGTPATVEKRSAKGVILTGDDAVLEALGDIRDSLFKIVTILELEFEQQMEYLDGQD